MKMNGADSVRAFEHLSSFLIKPSPSDLAVCFLVADCHEALLTLITPFIDNTPASPDTRRSSCAGPGISRHSDSSLLTTFIVE